ncbi:MAG: hypothetical protein LBQ31_08235 [Bacteroidales bacterium]|jgi:hypothetical protein|nr:hypothetical protein [Bacteroidales bacterium]
MNIKSDKKTISGSVEGVYSKISNLNNLSPFVGDKVKDWKATEDECSFSFSAMGTDTSISLAITEKIPDEKIVIQSKPNCSPIPFSAVLHLEKIDDSSFTAQTEIEADIPFALSMMVKKPLHQMADMIMQQLSKMAV